MFWGEISGGRKEYVFHVGELVGYVGALCSCEFSLLESGSVGWG